MRNPIIYSVPLEALKNEVGGGGNILSIYISASVLFSIAPRPTVDQIRQKCKETSNLM